MDSRFRWIAGLALAGALVLGACGDGSDDDATPTTAPGTSSTAGATQPGGWAPAPRLRDNIISVTPAHASTVPAAQTQPASVNQPGGICFEVTMTGLENPNLQWFQFALDGVNLTAPSNEQGEFTWFQKGEGFIGCFAPAKALTAGRHTAAASVQNPNSATEPTKQVVSWQFDVQ
ncbi:MAG: hypothetical protein IT303_16030 [Dehalococcoidia bacterium]|nr:hypothetical protein [Dehalococcoidia bacterium]